MPDENDNLDLEEQDYQAAPAGKKGGGGLIKIIIILVIVVAAVGGGYVAAQMFFFPPAEEEDAEAEQAEAPTGDDQSIFDPENMPGALEFTTPFLIRLRRAASMLRGEVYLKVGLTLEVASEEIREEMEGNTAVMSRISDTIISYLASKYPEDVDAASWPRLKEELIAKINEQFPEAYHIRRISFREFVVQAR